MICSSGESTAIIRCIIVVPDTTIRAGERVIDPGLAAAALSAGVSPLSDREREVLQAGRAGAGIADIARSLFLSEGTVRNYLSSAIQKLEVSNRMEATRIAEEQGWL